MDIRDKRAELYVQPKPKVVAFSGAGRKLGRYITTNGGGDSSYGDDGGGDDGGEA